MSDDAQVAIELAKATVDVDRKKPRKVLLKDWKRDGAVDGN